MTAPDATDSLPGRSDDRPNHYACRAEDTGCCSGTGRTFEPDDRFGYVTIGERGDSNRLGRGMRTRKACVWFAVALMVGFIGIHSASGAGPDASTSENADEGETAPTETDAGRAEENEAESGSTGEESSDAGAEAPRVRPFDGASPAHALIWGNAEIFRQYRGDASFRLHAYPDASRSRHPAHGYVVRALGETDGWVKVRNVAASAESSSATGHCGESDLLGDSWTLKGRGSVALEMWVRRDDLMSVVTEPIERAFDDGSSIHLKPGVPVADGRPVLDGLELPVQLEESETGSIYEPTDGTPASKVDALDETVVDGSVALDGSKLSFDTEDVYRRNEEDDAPDRLSVAEQGCGVARFANRDARVPQNPADRIRDQTVLRTVEAEAMRKGGDSETREVSGIEIPSETTLRWPSGEDAGRVVEAIHLKSDDVSRPEDADAVCFDIFPNQTFGVPDRTDDHLTVCAPADDVRERSFELESG